MSSGVVDIARRCEVSPSTVCRALNGKSDINEETRRRVLTACDELGYARNSSARSLRLGCSTVVACLTADRHNELFIEKLYYLKQAIAEAGYTPRIYSYSDGEQALMFLREIVSTRPAGVITDMVPDGAMRPLLTANGVPVVLYDCSAPGLDSVCVDRECGCREAVAHMLALGRGRIVLLGASLDSERGRGYSAAHRAAGLAVESGLVVDARFGRNLFAYGYEQILALCGRVTFDGILAVNDASAIGALRALSERGLAVPESVLVVGFDGIMASAFTNPPLSTVLQPVGDMAGQTVHLLLRRIADADTAVQHVKLPTRLLLRGSS